MIKNLGKVTEVRVATGLPKDSRPNAGRVANTQPVGHGRLNAGGGYGTGAYATSNPYGASAAGGNGLGRGGAYGAGNAMGSMSSLAAGGAKKRPPPPPPAKKQLPTCRALYVSQRVLRFDAFPFIDLPVRITTQPKPVSV